MGHSRRKFLEKSTMGLSAMALSGHQPFALPAQPVDGPTEALQIGVAGYTFHKVSLDRGLEIMRQVDIKALSIKDFYLPLQCSDALRDSVLQKFQQAGVEIYAAGVIYMKTRQEVDQAFEYAAKIPVSLIIGVPTPELLPYVEQKVKQTNIRIAIHNHGPEDELYPGPKNVYEKVKNLDPRIGMCFDIGHGLRAGADPVSAILSFKERIFDLHIKDIADKATAEHAIQMGRGIMDLPSVIKALYQIRFRGRCSIEFEMNVDDPLPGLAECAGYFRGVSQTVRTMNL